jgi:hypothetical protein
MLREHVWLLVLVSIASAAPIGADPGWVRQEDKTYKGFAHRDVIPRGCSNIFAQSRCDFHYGMSEAWGNSQLNGAIAYECKAWTQNSYWAKSYKYVGDCGGTPFAVFQCEITLNLQYTIAGRAGPTEHGNQAYAETFAQAKMHVKTSPPAGKEETLGCYFYVIKATDNPQYFAKLWLNLQDKKTVEVPYEKKEPNGWDLTSGEEGKKIVYFENFDNDNSPVVLARTELSTDATVKAFDGVTNIFLSATIEQFRLDLIIE